MQCMHGLGMSAGDVAEGGESRSPQRGTGVSQTQTIRGTQLSTITLS